MGYLTTITIHNDALHVFEKKPEEFAKAVFEGIREAQKEHREVSVPFSCYANYINVQPSRHADDETVYLHSGNCVSNLNAWSDDWLDLIERLPDVAKKNIKRAKQIIKYAEEKLKEAEKEKKI